MLNRKQLLPPWTSLFDETIQPKWTHTNSNLCAPAMASIVSSIAHSVQMRHACITHTTHKQRHRQKATAANYTPLLNTYNTNTLTKRSTEGRMDDAATNPTTTTTTTTFVRSFVRSSVRPFVGSCLVLNCSPFFVRIHRSSFSVRRSRFVVRHSAALLAVGLRRCALVHLNVLFNDRKRRCW